MKNFLAVEFHVAAVANGVKLKTDIVLTDKGMCSLCKRPWTFHNTVSFDINNSTMYCVLLILSKVFQRMTSENK